MSEKIFAIALGLILVTVLGFAGWKFVYKPTSTQTVAIQVLPTTTPTPLVIEPISDTNPFTETAADENPFVDPNYENPFNQ